MIKYLYYFYIKIINIFLLNKKLEKKNNKKKKKLN